MGKCISTISDKEPKSEVVTAATASPETAKDILCTSTPEEAKESDTLIQSTFTTTPTTASAPVPPGVDEHTYADEGNNKISELIDLGIGDETQCREALIATNGNLLAAVEWLFNQPNITQNTQITQSKSNNMNELQKWCLNNGFTMDFYNRLKQPPMCIESLQKLKYLTSDNDINGLVQELGLRFGNKVTFVQAMKHLKQESNVAIKSNNDENTEGDVCPSLNIQKKHIKPVSKKRRTTKRRTTKRRGSKQNDSSRKKKRSQRIPVVTNKKCITFGSNPILTQNEINGECHLRESVIPYRSLQDSNFLKLYDETKRVPNYCDIINSLPSDLIADFKECYKSICIKYKSKESMDSIIGRSCVQAWTHEDNQFTASKFYCKLNAALLSDHSELLKKWMFLIRGLNRFLVDTRPKRDIICYRKSDLSRTQFHRIKVGGKYRIAMYTATSTDREFVKKWNRNSGQFYWIFKVPKGCYNACCIAEYSYHGEESEVLMPPYSSIEIVSKHAGYITANVLDNKHCSMSLPTIVS